MKLFKKLICCILSVSVMLSCLTGIVFATDGVLPEEGVEDTQIPTENKTVYNFECKEAKLNLDKTEIVGDEIVAFYQGYETLPEKGFSISAETFPAFRHGLLLKRNKSAAANVTYAQAAYGNNGKLYDGLDGRDYFMSFDITTGATVYMVDREREYWPSKPDDWYVAGYIGTFAVYGKHFDAGQRVQVPCYGWKDSWDKTAARLFLDPSYYVIAWDNDTNLEKFEYSKNSNENIQVTGFQSTDKGGEYDVKVEYEKGGCDISLSLIPKDKEAVVTMLSGEESFKLTYGTPVTVSYSVTSEAGDETDVYTATFTMEEKKDTNISVNPAVSNFGASEDITNIYEADDYVGDTTVSTVPIASYDKKGYFTCAEYKIVYLDDDEEKEAYVDYKDIYSYIDKYEIVSATVHKWKYTDENMYMVSKGGAFFTDEGNFGITGSAYDNVKHIMTSSQLAPGKVKAESFANASLASEFKSWLLQDENYAYSITPNNNCVVYVAFTQAKAKNHTKFINDGWTFNDYSGVSIPESAVLDAFKGYASYKWWMTDAAYNYNGYPFLLIKNQYSESAATVSRNYYYVWSKEVKAGECVEIPVGGSAFSSASDQNAPKTMFIWQDKQIRDDVSGEFLIGGRNLLIDNSFESRPLPAMVASIGDEISFNSDMGATAVLSQNVITELPCFVDATITSEAGTSVSYSINVKKQPNIISVNVSDERSKFITNSGGNKIELTPYLVGELLESTASRQVFEQDAEGVLQPVYGDDGKYLFEKVKCLVGRPFYRDRQQHKFCHVGQGFKNLQYFWIPSNDSISRRNNVYKSENTTYMEDEKNGGEEKLWDYVNEDGVTEKLNYLEMSAKYENYVLGDNEYFDFTADGAGVVYVALEEESPNYNVSKGWKHMSVEVPIPEGHVGWNSVEAEVISEYYPYQLGKIQYDGHATDYQVFDEIYYKAFEANEKVTIPTTGLSGSNVCAVMVGWEDFVTDNAGGVLSYGKNSVNIRNSREEYLLNVYSQEDIDISYKPAYPYSRVSISDTKVKIKDLPKTITIKVTNAFCAEREFKIRFEEGNLGDKKIYNFDTASDYYLYDSQETGVYNTDKGFIKFSEGLYMLEENLERGVSSYYSDRLTHKFTKENTSEIFEGATYVRRPKKSGDYGNLGMSCTSAFYNDDSYNGKEGNGYWLSFGISSDADVYVGIPGDGIWPNKPDDWQEVTDESIKLAGCTKVYMHSYSTGDFVGIPSTGWYSGWDNTKTSWDLPVYVVVWK